jgi:hypothetical protein
MKRKFNQGCSSIPSISTKQPIIPHLNKLNTPKKITAYDIGNLGPGVGHVQLCAYKISRIVTICAIYGII